jgi:hypothetical protein
MGFDHILLHIPKAKFADTVRFYTNALAPLGYTVLRDMRPARVGFGVDRPDFWLMQSDADESGVKPVHVAFGTNGE